MIIFDVLLVAAAVIAALHFLMHLPLTVLTVNTRLPLFEITAGEASRCLFWFMVALFAVAWHYGLYSRSRTRSFLNEQRLSLQACLAAGLLLCGGLYLFAGVKTPRAAVAVTVATVAVIFGVRRAGTRYRAQRRYRRGVGRRRLLIAGENRISQVLREQVVSCPDLGYEFRGFLRVPGAIAGAIPGSISDRYLMEKDVAGTIHEVAGIAPRCFIDEVIITACGDYQQVKQAIEVARVLDLDLRIVPGVHEPLTLRGPLSYLGNVPLFYLHRRRPPQLSMSLKRGLDVIVALAGIAASLPVMICFAAGLALEEGSNIFSAVECVGRRSVVFRRFRFQPASRARGESKGIHALGATGRRAANAPSGRRVRRFFSQCGLEGLPQLFNVLAGDMSLVGPRPLTESDARSHHAVRLRCLKVAPGITGLWRIQRATSEGGSSSAGGHSVVDEWYVDNWSLWLDLKIVLRWIRGLMIVETVPEAIQSRTG